MGLNNVPGGDSSIVRIEIHDRGRRNVRRFTRRASVTERLIRGQIQIQTDKNGFIHVCIQRNGGGGRFFKHQIAPRVDLRGGCV